MTRMTGSDHANIMCNLRSIHAHTNKRNEHQGIICYPLFGRTNVSIVESNDKDDRAKLRGYLQFNKYTHMTKYH